MRVKICEDYDCMSRYAAELICNRINDFENTRLNSSKLHFVLGLPIGSTPLGTYKRLIELHREGRVSFENVITFNMDEYVGIPRDDPQSYHTLMFDNFFRFIDISPENVNILNGNATDINSECLNYEKKIAAVGGIDLFLGGIGANGHIAFNEPGSSLKSRTRLQALTKETIEANSRFFDGDCSKVPTHALTVGVATVMDAKEVVILVNGTHKAQALRDAIEGGVSHLCTASVFQFHEQTTFVVDKPATVKLRVETVQIFGDSCQDERTEFGVNKHVYLTP